MIFDWSNIKGSEEMYFVLDERKLKEQPGSWLPLLLHSTFIKMSLFVKDHSMLDLKLLFLEPYLIGSLCGETILFLLFWIYLIFVMFVFDLLTPVYLGVSLFLISMNLYYLPKKKCHYLSYTQALME